MIIAFYVGEMNYRGVVNSTYQLARYSKKLLKYKPIIFYDSKNKANKGDVIKKFKKKFKTFGISNFSNIENFNKKYNFDFIYIQKGGVKDKFVSKEIKTLIHAVYPQKLNQIHGYNYFYISEWLAKKFSNSKLSYLPYIVEKNRSVKNLKKYLKIKNDQLVFGCHGGESSFDLKFVQDVLIRIANERNDTTFLFLNINKFCNHPKIKFLKGTINDSFKSKFINTCDAMIYGRSLGETFGLACAEFAINNKRILSYKYNRHQNHNFSLSKDTFFEYSSYGELYNLICDFQKKIIIPKKNKYLDCSPKKVMKLFKKIVMKPSSKLNTYDYFVNFINLNRMYYFYIRHKIYNHYYNLFAAKFWPK